MKRSKKEDVFFAVLIAGVFLMLDSSNAQSMQRVSATMAATISAAQDTKGVVMVYVPSGTFRMGTTSDTVHRLCTDVESKETQPDQLENCIKLLTRGDVLSASTVKMSPFWIDQFEVTLAQYQECVQIGFCTDIDLSRTPDLANPDTKPQVGVTWYQAVRFCNYRGARLPTEKEWQFAASGPDNKIYPWGNSLVPAYVSPTNSTRPVGSMAGDRSWIGIYDMGGNVAEWVEDLYLPYSDNPANWSEFSEVDRVSRGGSWGSGGLLWTTFLRTDLDPEEVNPTQGFRCARSSPPTLPK